MGRLCRIKSKTREQWLETRTALASIGGSDSAAVAGVSPWKTASELWKEKTGQSAPKDLSNDAFVQKGIAFEPILRSAFKTLHKDEFRMAYHGFDILYQKDRPWLTATLDGELTEIATKRKGVYEAKTSTPVGKAGWEKWKYQIPTYYLCQLLHNMWATGYDFAILHAALFNQDNDITIREYRFEREELQEDMDWLLRKETEFWDSVQNKTIPPITFVF